MEKREPRSRKKKTFGLKGWAAVSGITVAAAALIGTLVYIQIGKQYETVFFPNTTINGMDASKKSVDEVKELISREARSYVLSIRERGGNEEQINGSDIGLEPVFDGKLEAVLSEQEPNQWFQHRKTPQTFDIDTMIQFDQDKFREMIDRLPCFQEEGIEKPESAYISGYETGRGYTIVAAKEGNQLDQEKAVSAISQAVLALKPEISLEEAETYMRPQVPTDDPELVSRVQTMNQYTGTTITYNFGGEKTVLDGDTISQWIKTGEDGKVYLDSGAVTSFVKGLASKRDTYNKAKTLKTSYAQTVRITGGVFGWRIDQSAEADELAQLIRSGQSQEREPVYKQKGASHGETDYGNTYVEVNLTAQQLFFYKDGKLVVKTDFVSGNESKGWSTPAGVYSISYKERNATLKGENYRTPVSYWMPFNGNIGFHDASWRNTFGGTIFKTGGSHGCVNLPPASAKIIFENIASGVPVLCYHLPGTESKAASGETAKPEETKPAETKPSQGTTAPATEAPKPTTSAPVPTTEAVTKAPETEPSTSASSPENQEKGPGASSNTGKKEVGPGVVR